MFVIDAPPGQLRRPVLDPTEKVAGPATLIAIFRLRMPLLPLLGLASSLSACGSVRRGVRSDCGPRRGKNATIFTLPQTSNFAKISFLASRYRSSVLGLRRLFRRWAKRVPWMSLLALRGRWVAAPPLLPRVRTCALLARLASWLRPRGLWRTRQRRRRPASGGCRPRAF